MVQQAQASPGLMYVIVVEKKVVAAGDASIFTAGMPQFHQRIKVGDGRYIVRSIIWDLSPGINQVQFFCDTITRSDKFLD